MDIADVTAIVDALDLVDDRPTRGAAFVVVAALAVGPSARSVARFLTGVMEPAEVDTIAANLVAHGVWDGDTMAYLWLDDFVDDDGIPDRGEIGLILDCMVGTGRIQRHGDRYQMNEALTLDLDQPAEVIDVGAAPAAKLRSLFLHGSPSKADVAALIVRLERAEHSVATLQASRTGARSDSPDTSAAAAGVRNREGTNLAAFRANTHKHRLLAAYAAAPPDGIGITDPEAAAAAELPARACWWKRSSELRQLGYIAVTGHVREDPDSGADRECCEITDSGRAYLDTLGPPHA